MTVAIIPARAGSKRIKNKNIVKINGTPMIVIIINLLKKSKIFEKIIISTDSEKIAELSKNNGAEVPFLRSAKLSNDFATTDDVMQNIIQKLNNQITSKYICCVYPTAILMQIKDLKKAYQLIKQNNLDYVFTASRFEKSIFRSFLLNKNKIVKQIFKENYNKRSQDLDLTFFDAGQFYWGKKQSWLKKKVAYESKSTIIEIPNYRSKDIDNKEDLKIAIKKFNLYGEKKII